MTSKLVFFKENQILLNIFRKSSKFRKRCDNTMLDKGAGVAELIACPPAVQKVRGLNLSAYHVSLEC
jgi:hypothetical protein